MLFTIFAFVVPGETEPLDKNGSIDYVGAFFGVVGLILFNFAWKYDSFPCCFLKENETKFLDYISQAPLVGWDTPYEYILLIISVFHFASFIVWEWKFAKDPILPLDIWTSPSFGIVVVVTFFTFMTVGILVWYITLWNQQIRQYGILLCSATFATLAVLGAVAALVSSWLVPRVPAQFILATGSLSACVACILVSTMPAQQSYWAQLFPAFIFAAFGPDFIFTAAQIISSNTVKRQQQGIAGSLIGTLVSYGLSTGLGFAGTVEVYSRGTSLGVVQGYRNALYLGIGMAGSATVLALSFVRIPKDEREGWGENDLSVPVQ